MTSIFDLINLIASNIWVYGGTFLLVLSILVFVHEWGHYIVARLCGVRVEIFSIGFGKEIFGLNDKHGTRWKFSMIPLGGYVKMYGDTDPASTGHKDEVEGDDGAARPMSAAERNVAFFAKPVWQRALVVFAGPAINFIFAIILLAGLYMFYGQPVSPPKASAIMIGSAADAAGFEPHDTIVSINGVPIRRFEDIRRIVTIALDTPLTFELERNGEIIERVATPQKEVTEDRFGFPQSRGLLGIIGPGDGIMVKNIRSIDGQNIESVEQARQIIDSRMGEKMIIELDRISQIDEIAIQPLNDINLQSKQQLEAQSEETPDILMLSDSLEETFITHNPLGAIGASAHETWNISVSTLKALGQMITGTRSATELGGIIRIGAIAGDMAQAGFIALITFTALLSINLGLINLFPIPTLDGGHLVFYALEVLKGGPISEKVQDYAFRFGFVVLIGIMLFANLNDIVQLIN